MKRGAPGTGSGAGRQQVASAGGDISSLEVQLTAQADALYEGILDLNVPMTKLSSDWSRLLQLRSRLLVMYGVPMKEAAVPSSAPSVVKLVAPATKPPAGKGKGKGAPSGAGVSRVATSAAAAALGPAESDHKSQLQILVSKRIQRGLTKGDLVYSAFEAEGGGFTASVTGPEVLSQEYWSAEPASSKRLAEHAAALAAIQAEFPGAVPGASQPPTKKRKIDASGAAAGAGAGAEDAKDPKSLLCHHAQLLLGRPVTKNDVAYEVHEVEGWEGKLFQATVSLPTYDPSAFHQGQPAENLKQAQANAAQAASEALRSIVEPLEEERKAKKAQQAQEKHEAFLAKKALAAAAE